MVYGCLNGHSRRVLLWSILPEQYSSVADVAGRFVAVESVLSNQYTYDQGLGVVNLGDGAAYSVASLLWPIDGTPQADPATPGPWPIETFVLNHTGRTARLYSTFAPGAGPGSNPTGQVLDVIGPDHQDRVLATTTAGAIPPASLAYHGDTVTWTENGIPNSARAPG
jgi:hypothetical protein